MRTDGVLAAAALGLLSLGWVSCRRDLEPAPVIEYTIVDVGVTAAERRELHYLSEGSDLVPVDLLRALVDPATGKVFIDSLPEYGFLASAASAENPYGLPLGWTLDIPDLSVNQLPYVGINCAACHTGRIDFGGHRLLIDGAPNMADIEGLGLAVRNAVVATLADPVATVEFVGRLARLRHPDAGALAVLAIPSDVRKFLDNLRNSVRGGDDPEVAGALQDLMRGESKDEIMRRVGDSLRQGKRARLGETLDILAKYVPVVKRRAEFGLRALHAIEVSPPAGPGRDDPWGLVRNVLFESTTPLTSPTSIPHLFHVADVDWYHADGNTNSIMQRDVTQAVALGAYVDPGTGESTLLPANIHRLEVLWSKVQSPVWPEEILGAIDRELAAQGAELFRRRLPRATGVAVSCADCHAARTALLVALDEVGTDPNRAVSFAQPLAGEEFAAAIPRTVGPIIQTALDKAGASAAEAAAFEPENVAWRTTGRYVARRLDGVWATAPYLHNGSVPTLHDLLRPAAERPTKFHLGHRDYDPERVGYQTMVAAPIFVFDTAIEGNSNAGHEYGAELSTAERDALVEYLKTL